MILCVVNEGARLFYLWGSESCRKENENEKEIKVGGRRRGRVGRENMQLLLCIVLPYTALVENIEGLGKVLVEDLEVNSSRAYWNS